MSQTRRRQLLRHQRSGKPEMDRLMFFSDGVFAIAITLLVLQITVPIPGLSEHQLGDALRHLGPKYFGFVLSFLVIGRYWMAHHRVFEYIKRFDMPLVWLNLAFLLLIAFLPFPTAVLG